ncbi:MAG: holo-ACP synthase [Anaerolineales bacterium]|nr:holo-ACP synthase [Chloroflexota bacterium]MBL6979648.1 holo-ACP synthase [Anaerolineales bacterium]
MRLTTGVDLIEIERIKDSVTRNGERFLKRVYTKKELALCGDDAASLAGRFAAKEAVAKALGCGIGDVRWQEIEVLRDKARAPVLILHGAAQELADSLGLETWSLSLSHTKSHAVAFVVAVG